MALTRVLPDTNVCCPISLLDLILRLDEADVHRVLWTKDLLAELHRTWLRNGARSPASATAICDAIRRTFPDGKIDRREYADLIETMPGKDPDDHVHAAAAVARAPVTIITANLADFPAKPLRARGVTVTHPDRYLCALLEDVPDDLVEIVSQMAADRHLPPMTVDDVIDALGNAGTPRFARQLRACVQSRR